MKAIATRYEELPVRSLDNAAFEVKRVPLSIPDGIIRRAVEFDATLSKGNAHTMRDLVIALLYWSRKYLQEHPDAFVPQLLKEAA